MHIGTPYKRADLPRILVMKEIGLHFYLPRPTVELLVVGLFVRECVFLKSISVKSQQANALPRMRSSASSFVRETSGADNSVSQPYFLTKSTCLYGLIATLMLMYQSFKLDIS